MLKDFSNYIKEIKFYENYDRVPDDYPISIGDILIYHGGKHGYIGCEAVVTSTVGKTHENNLVIKFKCDKRAGWDPADEFECMRDFLSLTVDYKKFKKIERPEIDPYDEEDWGFVAIQEGVEDYEFLKNYRLECINTEEMRKMAKRLNDIGFQVYNYGGVLRGELNDFIGFHWNEGDQSFNRTKRKNKDPLNFDKFMRLTTVGKKYKTLTNKKFDPYDEEDWGYEPLVESTNFSFQIGDHVIVNGISDDEEYENVHDIIVNTDKSYVNTNMDENGECEMYRYHGIIYLLESNDWWVSPYNLKKYEINRSYSDDDPYGEENINEDIISYIGRAKFKPIGKILKKIQLTDETINLLNENYTGWLKIENPSLSDHFLHVKSWARKGFDLIFYHDKIYRISDSTSHEYDTRIYTMNSGHYQRIKSIQKCENLGYNINRKFTTEDPYGEEDWDDGDYMWTNEAKKSDGILLDLKGNDFKKSIYQSIYSIMKGRRQDKDERDNIVELINKTIGKKVAFTNIKDGKRIKKERISEGGCWKQNQSIGNWDFYLKGTKKDYHVDIMTPIGYYGDAPKRVFNPIDPWDEEDWDN